MPLLLAQVTKQIRRRVRAALRLVGERSLVASTTVRLLLLSGAFQALAVESMLAEARAFERWGSGSTERDVFTLDLGVDIPARTLFFPGPPPYRHA